MTTIEYNHIVKKAQGRFNGGIHPTECKTLSNQQAIQSLPLPNFLILPVQQNIGQPGEIICQVGDEVSQGQLLVDNTEVFGANIHAPLAGKIIAIDQYPTNHPSGLPQTCLKIKTAKQQVSTELFSPINWQQVEPQQLLERIKLAGIVGLGGAAFPTHVKLAAQPINTLIVNAMECEPYITCDDRLLQEQSQQVIQGALISAKIVNAKEIIFATEDNKPDAIKQLSQCIKQIKSEVTIKIIVAPTKYPSGGEKQTIELVTGKQLPKGKLPASMGLLVQNVATLFAVYQAVNKGMPLTSRLVTLTGNQIKTPGNYWIPFGTTIESIMQHFDISDFTNQPVVMGGPLMGQPIFNYQAPVTKATNCLIFNIAATDEKMWLTQSTQHQPCIRCGECDKACPVDLLPQQLFWFSQSDQWDNLENQGLFDCIECGACAYVCPSEIPLVHYYRYGKSSIKTIQRNHEKSEKAKKRFEFREMRLARAKEERALKHKKAAEARKKAAQDKKADPTGKQTAINEALARVKAKKSAQNSTNPQPKE